MGTIIAWIALLAGVAALGLVWKLSQDMARVTRRLDRYNRALFDAGDQIRKLEEQLAHTEAQLRVEIMRGSGQLRVEPSMTVREITALHPQAEQLLAGLHIGGCSSCAVEPNETLAQICTSNGIDLNMVVSNLNNLVQADTRATNGGSRVPQPVKIPNVELSL
jgi:hypothetical protein